MVRRLKNEKRYDMYENDSEVIFNKVENGKMLGPHALCVLMHWGDTSIHHEGTDAYIH